MKKYSVGIVIGIMAACILGYVYFSNTITQPVISEDTVEPVEDTRMGFISHLTPKDNIILLERSFKNEFITSPLRLAGQARGYWFFEGSFPVTLTNWDGLIIAEGYAEAEGDWMTTDFVPFTAMLEFESPYKKDSADFMQSGSLILHRDNPSDLSENDDALELTVQFEAVD